MILRGLISNGAIAVAFVALLTAQEPPPPASPKPAAPRRDMRQFLGLSAAPDPVAAARGEKLYTPNCAFCHGATARGAEGPDLLRSALVLHDEKGELIGPLLHTGRPDKGMPAFASLSDAQIYDLAEFLHQRIDLSANRGLYEVPNIVTGNAAAGKAYFDGAGHCASCHSPTGDLAHIGSRMQPADLQQAFLYPTGRGSNSSKPALTHVTVTMPSGKIIAGTLKRIDDFNVSLLDSSGVYQSIERVGGVKVDVEDKLRAHRELLDHYSDSNMHDLTAYLVTLK